ncbi:MULTISPECIES: hypothetical protein [Sinorhizobium]|uniref:hypothetical protein n=1 Tax=Sinorhizobium TaxID=28105 RepID=UPI0004BBBF2E|nr:MULTISPECIES: hypothetical protein [Sinorhizobium]
MGGLHDVQVIQVTDGREFAHQIAYDQIDAPRRFLLIAHDERLELIKGPAEGAVEFQGRKQEYSLALFEITQRVFSKGSHQPNSFVLKFAHQNQLG